MKYIGNFQEFIQKEWFDYMDAHEGEIHPKRDSSDYGDDNHFSKYIKAGYDANTTWWHSYEERSFPFDIQVPIEGKTINWWFVKMFPGQFIPIHRDSWTKYKESICKRYWMPLQDYTSGHIFIIGNTMLSKYKAGDLFEYPQDELHGPINLSSSIIRYTFNFVQYTDDV